MVFTDALMDINNRFQSSNSVPVERARITLLEFESILAEFKKLQGLNLEYQEAITAIHKKLKPNTP